MGENAERMFVCQWQRQETGKGGITYRARVPGLLERLREVPYVLDIDNISVLWYSTEQKMLRKYTEEWMGGWFQSD